MDQPCRLENVKENSQEQLENCNIVENSITAKELQAVFHAFILGLNDQQRQMLTDSRDENEKEISVSREVNQKILEIEKNMQKYSILYQDQFRKKAVDRFFNSILLEDKIAYVKFKQREENIVAEQWFETKIVPKSDEDINKMRANMEKVMTSLTYFKRLLTRFSIAGTTKINVQENTQIMDETNKGKCASMRKELDPLSKTLGALQDSLWSLLLYRVRQKMQNNNPSDEGVAVRIKNSYQSIKSQVKNIKEINNSISDSDYNNKAADSLEKILNTLKIILEGNDQNNSLPQHPGIVVPW